MKIDKSLMSGSTTLLILRLLENADMYGYQMIEELEKRSQNVFTLKAGTLYPLLHTLEQQKMIESYETTTANGRPRKYYRITKAGRKMLEEKKAEWQVYTSAVNKVLGGDCYVGI
ncbi:PadR family transcriptional regulator [Acetivibrio clariflavus]|uniref:Putative transcriptional regulator n=1 Tax=Acetivibrio clariflavus (strain DSM 19732 / NBRC 101661 / EBR45) TaxID=720554 RepID=G8LSX1_ACECE|nr:helix-turn-helix transcriptional regulator [Acetivibrio clariflavus]AEV70484.1 putative transcriptional regulator [Acetivibrio clariflavus DSM 19732]